MHSTTSIVQNVEMNLFKETPQIRQIPKFNLLEGVISDEVKDSLIEMCDAFSDKNSIPRQDRSPAQWRWSGFENHGKPYDDKLVGRIDGPQSKQIQINPRHPNCRGLVEVLRESTDAYVTAFRGEGNGNIIGGVPDNPYMIEISDIWSVHQYENDYNPMHFHATEHHSTLSGFLHLKVPEQIPKGYFDENKLDGITELLWDTSTADYMRQFIYNGNQHHVPYPGLFAVFPSWLNHVVYPFKGPGERLSMSWNIGINYK